MLEYLPTVNAALNATAAVLLVIGFWLIKSGREVAHRRTMLAAFGVSMLFLSCYLVYHALKSWHTVFGGPEPWRTVYYVILISHVLLAATVPFLAGATIYLGLRDRRAGHRRLAVWAFPIWLYVSVTGVVIYGMLYHLYPPETKSATIGPAAVSIAPLELGHR